MTTVHENLIARLYRENYLLLYRYALSVMREREAAEDAVQRVFELACEKADELPELINPRAWLIGVLKNVLRNMERKRQTRERRQEELGPEAKELRSERAGPEENVDYMRPAQVSQEDFELFKYVHVHGFTCAEASKRFGISEAACYKRIQRTREKLKKYINSE